MKKYILKFFLLCFIFFCSSFSSFPPHCRLSNHNDVFYVHLTSSWLTPCCVCSCDSGGDSVCDSMAVRMNQFVISTWHYYCFAFNVILIYRRRSSLSSIIPISAEFKSEIRNVSICFWPKKIRSDACIVGRMIENIWNAFR